jgi:hypothetical protein
LKKKGSALTIRREGCLRKVGSRKTWREMQTVGIVLNIDEERTAEFEQGFRDQEAPIWQDLHQRGFLTVATLNRLDISTKPANGAVQYLVVAIFSSDEGHHVHDSDPRFDAWNKRADEFQIEEPFVFGGDTVVHEGP